jgi:hypothetical protein
MAPPRPRIGRGGRFALFCDPKEPYRVLLQVRQGCALGWPQEIARFCFEGGTPADLGVQRGRPGPMARLALNDRRCVLQTAVLGASVQKCRHCLARALLGRQHVMREQENTSAMPVGGE